MKFDHDKKLPEITIFTCYRSINLLQDKRLLLITMTSQANQPLDQASKKPLNQSVGKTSFPESILLQNFCEWALAQNPKLPEVIAIRNSACVSDMFRVVSSCIMSDSAPPSTILDTTESAKFIIEHAALFRSLWAGKTYKVSI